MRIHFSREKARQVESIDAFVDRLFADRGDGAEEARAKERVLNRLMADYDARRAEGLGDEEARVCALTSFGAAEAADNAIRLEKRRTAYEKFRRRYPWMVRLGILGILVLPLIAAFLFHDADHKARALAAWTVAIIALVAFVIGVEYADSRYQRQLRGDPPPEHSGRDEKGKEQDE